MPTRYWIIVASKDHVEAGVKQGFAQACHGKASPLKRMKPDDWVIYYSPKTEFGKAEKCQCFTAIGQVIDEQIYQAIVNDTFTPFRRNIQFLASQNVAIQPLIPELSFIKNKQKWGSTFRFGMLEIPQSDFERIAVCILGDSMKLLNPLDYAQEGKNSGAGCG